MFKKRFIRVDGHYPTGVFYLNINYIVRLFTWTAVNGFIHYNIEYYDRYKNLVSGDISKDDYKKLIGNVKEYKNEKL